MRSGFGVGMENGNDATFLTFFFPARQGALGVRAVVSRPETLTENGTTPVR